MTEIEFDHHAPEYAADWRNINADLRKRCPVAHTQAHDGFWVLASYADVAAASGDDDTFSSYQPQEGGGYLGAVIPPSPLRQVPIEMDPPEFFAYRKLLNPHFSPAASKAWEPYLRQVTTYCIDRVIEAGSCDLVRDITSPVPAILTLKILGLPTDDWQRFSDDTHALVHAVPGSAESEAAMLGMFAIIGQIQEAVQARREVPTEDLLSILANATVDGELMTVDRVIEIVTLVILGGVDTTGSLISSVLEWLTRHPAEMQRLKDEPALLDSATEEFLRYFAPVPGLARTTTTGCTMGEQAIDAGERIFLSWASANYDETVFLDPEQVDLERFPNRHLSFGRGIHRCLGSNLARMEFRIVLEEILRRMPDYRIGEGAAPYESIGVVNGWIDLPATFTPGSREGDDVRP